MASFTVEGQARDRTVRIEWRDGALTAPDPTARALVLEQAASGESVGLAGIGAWESGLEEPLQALATCRRALDGARVTESVDMPYPPAPEPPAVA